MKNTETEYSAYTRTTALALTKFYAVNTDIPLIIDAVDGADVEAAKEKLSEFYSPNTAVKVNGSVLALGELGQNHCGQWVIEPISFFNKEKYGFMDLLHIMEMLTSDNGCPWDRAQTHESIRANIIEEAYEAIDAIDNHDLENMKEEMGDLLLQSVFHCVIAKKENEFDYSDMLNTLCTKLITRHAHVFGSVKAATAEGALDGWESAKTIEKRQETLYDKLCAIPRVLPQSLRTVKVAKRAAKVGIGTSVDAEACISITAERLSGLADGVSEDGIGECLYGMCNLARLNDVDPEIAFKKTIDRYVSRCREIERVLNGRGVRIDVATQAQIDSAVAEAVYHDSFET